MNNAGTITLTFDRGEAEELLTSLLFAEGEGAEPLPQRPILVKFLEESQ
jgi:hypothetical protein